MKPQKTSKVSDLAILLSDVGVIKCGFQDIFNAMNQTFNFKCISHWDLLFLIWEQWQNQIKFIYMVGFLMNVQDIETAVRNKINVVAMVWFDGEYGLIGMEATKLI